MSDKIFETDYVISLRVTYPEISADRVVSWIGAIPQVSQSVGATRAAPNGQKLGGVYRRTYVLASITKKTRGYLVDGIESAVGLLRPKRRELATIVETGGVCELFVGVFTGENLEFELSHRILEMLNECSLGLSIDAYLEQEGGGGSYSD